MPEHPGADNRRERKEDIAAAFQDELPKALDTALPPALSKALPAELEKALWGDMRPARTWPTVRSHLEHLIEQQEGRVRRLQGLKAQASELGRGVIRDVIIHVIVSTSIIGTLLALGWKYMINGGVK